VAPNPFWYAKSIAALTSRDRLSICVLVMFAHKSVNQLNMTRISKPVKPPACCQPRSLISNAGMDDEDDAPSYSAAGTSGPFWSGGETQLRFNETWDPIWYPEGLERETQRKMRGKNI
jgi:hypothetical protein